MWQKFSVPSYTQWPSMDEALEKCVLQVKEEAERTGNAPGCFKTLDCVLEEATADQQAQLSAAGTILGLLPTVLSVVSISSDDLLTIHCRFPVLAFLLAMSNPSTTSGALVSVPVVIRRLRTKRSPGLEKVITHGIALPYNIHVPLSFWLHDVILHFLASGCVAMISYQVLMIGWKGVVVFACWTWHNPFTWISAGAILHIMQVVAWRWCLGPIDANKKWSRWAWSISRSGSNLTMIRPRLARFWALFFQVTSLMNYGYGTVVLSGTMLISPYIALRTFVLIGLSGLLVKLMTLWLVTIYPDVGMEDGNIAEGIAKGHDGHVELQDMERTMLLKDDRKPGTTSAVEGQTK